MTRFDWIDFGYSWDDSWDEHVVDLKLHTSTSCSLASILRGRSFPHRKIFVWIKKNKGIKISNTKAVFHIEAPFSFQKYLNGDYDDRLDTFSYWLIDAIASGAKLLEISDIEKNDIFKEIKIKGYEYIRRDKVKFREAKLRYFVQFNHTPYEVFASIHSHGGGLVGAFPPNVFARDELSYGKSVQSCWIEQDNFFAQTSLGLFVKNMKTEENFIKID